MRAWPSGRRHESAAGTAPAPAARTKPSRIRSRRSRSGSSAYSSRSARFCGSPASCPAECSAAHGRTCASRRWVPSSRASSPRRRSGGGVARSAQPLIPGPVGFYGTFALVLLPTFGALALIMRRLGKRSTARGTARWAHGQDLRSLRVRASRARPTDPRTRRGTADRRRAETVGDRRRANADRQDDRVRDPRDPRMARARSSRRRSRQTSSARRLPRARRSPERRRTSTTRPAAPAFPAPAGRR